MTSAKFVPLADYVPPQNFPAKLTAILPDGSFEDFTLLTRYDQYSFSGPVIAIRVEEPHLGQRMLNAFAESEAGRTIYGPQIDAVAKFAKWAADRGYLQEPCEEEADPLKKELVRIHREYRRLPRTADTDIRNWFEKPDRYPEVPFNIGNSILTVKEVSCGKVIVCPNGHTLAYSYARALYGILCGREPFDHRVNSRSVKARPFYGRDNWGNPRATRWSMKHGVLSVGCQRIPVHAIRQLARREGWDGEILNKYL
tara:strand:- start:3347 stop:4111 length:765 start_codon:yes stop_codon:yes gene_type:complete